MSEDIILTVEEKSALNDLGKLAAIKISAALKQHFNIDEENIKVAFAIKKVAAPDGKREAKILAYSAAAGLYFNIVRTNDDIAVVLIPTTSQDIPFAMKMFERTVDSTFDVGTMGMQIKSGGYKN